MVIQLLTSIAGGAYAAGAVTAAGGATLDMKVASTSGLSSIRYEIYDFPPAFSLPTGWSNDTTNNIYYYAPTNVTTQPPTVTLSTATANGWGKYMLRVRGNGNPLARNADGTPNAAFLPQNTDESAAVSVVSPNLGMSGLGFNESTQFSSTRGYAAAVMDVARKADTAPATAKNTVWYNNSSTPITVTTTIVYTTTKPPFTVAVDPGGGTNNINMDLHSLSPTDGDEITFSDTNGDCSLTSTVTIIGKTGGVGFNILGNPTYQMNQAGQAATLKFNGSTNKWQFA